mgnify:CR=1 FL=1
MKLSWVAGIVLLAAAGLARAQPAAVAVDSETLSAFHKVHSDFFDLDKNVVADPAEVDLGRLLFFDPRLSANKTMSCASCHNPSLAWADGLPRARGLHQQELSRNTPSLLNVHRNIQHPFFWDGRAETIEEATLTALQNRLEMNRDVRELVIELNRIPAYVDAFTRLYGLTAITPENLAKAVGAFITAEIRPRDSAFDRFARDPAALSPAARTGLKVFVDKGSCLRCHTGAFFSDDFFHNIGLKPTPGLEDTGRYVLVPDKHVWRAFRTPPLRDVALTAPYMHDGSLKTLRDVVEFYNRGGDDAEGRDDLVKPLGLDLEEREGLVAFLEALTSPARPFAVPVLPLEAEPATLAEGAGINARRLAVLEAAVARVDAAAVYANALAYRETVAVMRKLAAGDPSPAGVRAGECLQEPARLAWDLAHAADLKSSRSQLASGLKALQASAGHCRLGDQTRAAEPAAAADVLAGILAEAEDLVAALERDGRNQPRCGKGFSIKALLEELASGRLPEAEAVAERIRFDVLAYYEYRAFIARDPEVCRELKIPKVYFGISRTGDWSCREKFHEDMLAHALITRPPDFQVKCENSVVSSYPDLTREDAAGACGIIGRNLGAPDLCAKLIGKYLNPDKARSCENQFQRLYAYQDPNVCAGLDGGPTQWRDRCLALSAFHKAFKAEDPSLCEGRQLCRAFMGDAEGSVALAEAKVKALACAALDEGEAARRGLRRSALSTLLTRGVAALAAAEDRRSPSDLASARSIDARQERLARLARRAGP